MSITHSQAPRAKEPTTHLSCHRYGCLQTTPSSNTRGWQKVGLPVCNTHGVHNCGQVAIYECQSCPPGQNLLCSNDHRYHGMNPSTQTHYSRLLTTLDSFWTCPSCTLEPLWNLKTIRDIQQSVVAGVAEKPFGVTGVITAKSRIYANVHKGKHIQCCVIAIVDHTRTRQLVIKLHVPNDPHSVVIVAGLQLLDSVVLQNLRLITNCEKPHSYESH
jgi:hypothetical protein